MTRTSTAANIRQLPLPDPEPVTDPGPTSGSASGPGRAPLPTDLQPFRAASGEEQERLLAQGLVRLLVADIVVAVDAPDSREIRVAAAGLLIPLEPRAKRDWVVGFSSAAWLHVGDTTAGCRAPTELQVIIPPGRRRPRDAGVRGRQVALPPDQIMFLDGIAVTNPVRTAADVARDLPLEEALGALRRLGELLDVRPHQVFSLLSSMRYARGAATGRLTVSQWSEEA